VLEDLFPTRPPVRGPWPKKENFGKKNVQIFANLNGETVMKEEPHGTKKVL
jgi:two-component sensor histidine kinase